MIVDAIASLGPWAWILLGCALMALELMAPGVFLIWLGLAAVVTGLADGLLDLSWQVAWLVFAALSAIAVMVARMVAGSNDQPEPSPALNRRGQALVGRVFVLDEPIVAGAGRIRVDDSSWRVIGPEAPAGASMRVIRVEGATLVVEAA